MRCGAYGHAVHMVRCDAMHMTRCCSSLYKQDQSVYKPEHVVRCDAVHTILCDAVHAILCDAYVRCDAMHMSDAMRCIWSDAMRCIQKSGFPRSDAYASRLLGVRRPFSLSLIWSGRPHHTVAHRIRTVVCITSSQQRRRGADAYMDPK